MFCHNNKAFLFCLTKRCSRSALALSAPANGKKRPWIHPKVAAPAPQHCGMLDIINFLPSVNDTGEDKTS